MHILNRQAEVDRLGKDCLLLGGMFYHCKHFSCTLLIVSQQTKHRDENDLSISVDYRFLLDSPSIQFFQNNYYNPYQFHSKISYVEL